MKRKKGLAVSGGGAHGAFGAGTLAGLNKDYDIAAGISTGALMTPLVLLKDFDRLKEAYTSVTDKDIFDLKVRNVAEGWNYNELFCPGSTLKAHFKNTHPLAYGMPEDGLVLFRNSPVFEVVPGRFNENYETIVRYKEKDILKSGWLIGEKKIAKKSAMLVAKYGKGEIVLIGFPAQHRNQTDGTFKLLFNTIIN